MFITLNAQAYTELHSQKEVDAAFAKGRPMVILFATTWCPPCIATKPEFAAAEKEMPGVDFYLMDADTISLKMDRQYDGIPAFVAGKNEKEIRSAKSLDIGGKDKKEILEYVKKWTN